MNFKAKKSLGQNFLSNPRILDKIVSTAGINSNDIVVEIGPGTGNLTKRLSEKAGTVIAIEKDKRLIEHLRESFSKRLNVKILEEDVLKIRLEDLNLKNREYKIVANIPYYITSNFLRIIFEEWPQPETVVLTIQKEVAQRIVAKPPHMNILALSIQYYSEPRIAGYVSKNNFNPPPKVDSAIIKLATRPEPKNRTKNKELFQLIKAGFSEKRKQLLPVLSKNLKTNREDLLSIFKKLGLNEKIRAENLSLDQWIKLEEYLHA